MQLRRRSLLAATLCVTAWPLLGAAQTEPAQFSEREALAYSQAAIGRAVTDRELLTSTGEPLRLQSLRGTPVIVSMIYTSCYHICPMLTQRLAEVVAVARGALGEDSFAVLTVGFDSAVDTPAIMAQYARARGIEDPRWHFLSADSQTIDALSRDLGFIFFSSPKGFDHLSQTTLLDRDGRVYRQVYGQDFETPALVEPLKQLVFDTPEGARLLEELIDTVRLFCTIYDPRTGRYRFDYSIFMVIFTGVICLGAIAVFLARSWRSAV